MIVFKRSSFPGSAFKAFPAEAAVSAAIASACRRKASRCADIACDTNRSQRENKTDVREAFNIKYN